MTEKSKFKIGFIGAGNMATSIISGVLSKELCSPNEILIFDTDPSKLNMLTDNYGVTCLNSSTEIVHNADVVILAVKPSVYPVVLKEVQSKVNSKNILISIAPGMSMSFLQKSVEHKCKILRTMPNIASSAGVGLTLICSNHELDSVEVARIERIFLSFSKVEHIDESIIEAATAISGCGPAYIFVLIEALADAGVMLGVPRELSNSLAKYTIFGSGKLAIESDLHTAKLKDLVCTPGGTTIQGIYSLEQNGFRGIVMNAILAAAKKAQDMKNENN